MNPSLSHVSFFSSTPFFFSYLSIIWIVISYIWIVFGIWSILIWILFSIHTFSWTITIWYSVFVKFHEPGIQKFFMNEYIWFSVQFTIGCNSGTLQQCYVSNCFWVFRENKHFTVVIVYHSDILLWHFCEKKWQKMTYCSENIRTLKFQMSTYRRYRKSRKGKMVQALYLSLAWQYNFV